MRCRPGLPAELLRQPCSRIPVCNGVGITIHLSLSCRFFVVFVLVAQFVLVNVVVAVLMKHLEETHKQVLPTNQPTF